jgi:Flp pilus assembly protein CpaB
MLIAIFSENAFMKKTNIIATAAVATAGIAAYFIRRKFRAHKDQHNDHQAQPHGRHMTTVFARAKNAH